MSSPDPELWKEAAKWLWAALLIPVGMVWKKVDGAVQKDDFKEFIERFDEHCKNDREVQAKLFDQARENEQRAQDRYERLLEQLNK